MRALTCFSSALTVLVLFAGVLKADDPVKQIWIYFTGGNNNHL